MNKTCPWRWCFIVLTTCVLAGMTNVARGGEPASKQTYWQRDLLSVVWKDGIRGLSKHVSDGSTKHLGPINSLRCDGSGVVLGAEIGRGLLRFRLALRTKQARGEFVRDIKEYETLRKKLAKGGGYVNIALSEMLRAVMAEVVVEHLIVDDGDAKVCGQWLGTLSSPAFSWEEFCRAIEYEIAMDVWRRERGVVQVKEIFSRDLLKNAKPEERYPLIWGTLKYGGKDARKALRTLIVWHSNPSFEKAVYVKYRPKNLLAAIMVSNAAIESARPIAELKAVQNRLPDSRKEFEAVAREKLPKSTWQGRVRMGVTGKPSPRLLWKHVRKVRAGKTYLLPLPSKDIDNLSWTIVIIESGKDRRDGARK